ncbi:hydrogenase formation protein HypD [Lacrimispora defluvii]|uniref:Hydrogenase formation protein HypD n=1 Tax=Lacrimispora defluvii TaxID=2719233 RepID=A0ABX1VLD5_9FIRM|nr:hydrogenase formation protein HypD [Lacrimispora defluvii]NNJ28863.1 hydrogenase formation protein HypD [Lacrimispora defluvii]
MKIQEVIDKLKSYDGEPVKIMEVCGTHTSSIFKNGIRSMISPKIKLISGPGCPVCVTSAAYIDRLTEFSLKEDHCVLTFGDMMKVKGSSMSLTEAKAAGGKVKILYSPLMALTEAREHKNIQYLFAAVGFETTAPVYALMMEEMQQKNITNLKLLTSVKTIIPALSYICEKEKNIDAFLSPGHVSVITGADSYRELAEKYQKPFVIAGFEGEHILAAVYEIMSQLKAGRYEVKNMYAAAVKEKGNEKARALLSKYFEQGDDFWRGIGIIENSALRLKKKYEIFDGGSRIEGINEEMPKGCKCTDVILGRKNPAECPLFKTACTPLHAIGPCMVSSEGACGIWYQNS